MANSTIVKGVLQGSRRFLGALVDAEKGLALASKGNVSHGDQANMTQRIQKGGSDTVKGIIIREVREVDTVRNERRPRWRDG